MFLSIFFIGMAGIYLYEYFIYYYPEKFKIDSFNAKIYRVDHRDASRCYLLEDDISEIDTNSQYLLGIRFGVEYLSFEHENFFMHDHNPPGAFGHILLCHIILKEMVVMLPKHSIHWMPLSGTIIEMSWE